MCLGVALVFRVDTPISPVSGPPPPLTYNLHFRLGEEGLPEPQILVDPFPTFSTT